MKQMKKNTRIFNQYLIIMALVLIAVASCTKDNTDPEITEVSMTDQDGNTYKVITIGSQTWMAENLKTTNV